MPIGIGWIYAPKDINGNCAGVTKEWRESGEYEIETTHPGKDGLAEIVRRPVKISIKAPVDPKGELMYGSGLTEAKYDQNRNVSIDTEKLKMKV